MVWVFRHRRRSATRSSGTALFQGSRGRVPGRGYRIEMTVSANRRRGAAARRRDGLWLLFLKHDRERARQKALVVDHPDTDERTQFAKRSAYVVRAFGFGHEPTPPRAAHWCAGLHDDAQVQSGELLVTTDVLSERRNHLD